MELRRLFWAVDWKISQKLKNTGFKWDLAKEIYFLKINKRPPLYFGPRVNNRAVFRCLLVTSRRNQLFQSNDEFSHVRGIIIIFVAVEAVHPGWSAWENFAFYLYWNTSDSIEMPAWTLKSGRNLTENVYMRWCIWVGRLTQHKRSQDDLK